MQRAIPLLELEMSNHSARKRAMLYAPVFASLVKKTRPKTPPETSPSAQSQPEVVRHMPVERYMLCEFAYREHNGSYQ